MNNLFAFLILFLSTDFSKEEPQPDQIYTAGATSKAEFIDDPYNLELQLKPLENGQYIIVASVELEDGSWFASPYSADKYKGHFRITMKDNENTSMDGSFIEKPRSIAQLDKWRGEMGNIVTENTSYAYKLSVNSTDDFKVSGMVQFVIEPKCTFEEIPFSISNKAGKLSIQQYPKLDKRTCTKTAKPIK